MTEVMASRGQLNTILEFLLKEGGSECANLAQADYVDALPEIVVMPLTVSTAVIPTSAPTRQ
mgnify:FL=1